MKQNHEGKWCWCPAGAENYEGGFDHEWQAHSAAHNYASPGEKLQYEVAQKTHPLNLVTDNQIDRGIELMLEQIDQSCFDEVGGEDQVLELPNVDGNVLIEYVRTFLLERAKVGRWGVTNVKQHTVIAGVSTPVAGGVA